jgi:hypothetical protein
MPYNQAPAVASRVTLPLQADWMYPDFPSQAGFETGSTSQPHEWTALAEQAHDAELPPLPSHAEAAVGDRAELLRTLGYTFWNRELVAALAVRLREEPGVDRWLELAAGTGRLTAELARLGLDVVAADDYSQAEDRVRDRQRVIRYGSWVARLTAREALARFSPPGVICAWPPMGSCLVPDLLAGVFPGTEELRVVVCIGDPSGPTEAPKLPHEIAPGWTLEKWLEAARYLTGFNDPPDQPGSYSRLMVYRRTL